MGDSTRYLQNYKGIVEDVQLPGKAVIVFNLHDQQHRALLWVKGFVYQGKNLEHNDSFHGKLLAGETIFFDCHIYDRESRDNCGWYAPKAWKEAQIENVSNSPRLVNQTGYVFELDPGKGVILFTFNEQDQRVFFLRSKFYNFGKRPGNKHTLAEFLSENDPVQFDAEMCEPSGDNKMCQWFASLVWKGKKPTGAVWPIIGRSGMDELTADDSISNAERDDSECEFPSLSLPPGVHEKLGYKVYESGSCSREGRGNVISLINEECAVALWMVKSNTWESVFFHRKQAYIVDTCLSKFDLHESLVVGTALDITAIPALPDFPCRWIASKVVANY